MSDTERPETRREDRGDAHSQGPNLILLYTLIAVALAAAIALAAMIVWPFYMRR